jgi:hypothetical protein
VGCGPNRTRLIYVTVELGSAVVILDGKLYRVDGAHRRSVTAFLDPSGSRVLLRFRGCWNRWPPDTMVAWMDKHALLVTHRQGITAKQSANWPRGDEPAAQAVEHESHLGLRLANLISMFGRMRSSHERDEERAGVYG